MKYIAFQFKEHGNIQVTQMTHKIGPHLIHSRNEFYVDCHDELVLEIPLRGWSGLTRPMIAPMILRMIPRLFYFIFGFWEWPGKRSGDDPIDSGGLLGQIIGIIP